MVLTICFESYFRDGLQRSTTPLAEADSSLISLSQFFVGPVPAEKILRASSFHRMTRGLYHIRVFLTERSLAISKILLVDAGQLLPTLRPRCKRRAEESKSSFPCRTRIDCTENEIARYKIFWNQQSFALGANVRRNRPRRTGLFSSLMSSPFSEKYRHRSSEGSNF